MIKDASIGHLTLSRQGRVGLRYKAKLGGRAHNSGIILNPDSNTRRWGEVLKDFGEKLIMFADQEGE